MKISNVEIKNNLLLAPMAGIGDRAFRELCISYGAGYTVTEMVSSKGLTMGDKKSAELLTLGEVENPAATQIFGDDPEIMARSAIKCLEFNPSAIDINMGCPAPKVAGNGGGSALMREVELAAEIVKKVVNAVNVPVIASGGAGCKEDLVTLFNIVPTISAGLAASIFHFGEVGIDELKEELDKKNILVRL